MSHICCEQYDKANLKCSNNEDGSFSYQLISFLPDNPHMKWETLSTLRAISAGIVLVVLFIGAGFCYVMVAKNRHITYAVNRWIFVHLFFCMFSALALSCWVWLTAFTKSSSLQRFIFEICAILLFVSNICLFVSLVSMVLHSEYDMKYTALCRSRSKQKKSQERKRRRILRKIEQHNEDEDSFVLFFFFLIILFYLHVFYYIYVYIISKIIADEIYELPFWERYSNDQKTFVLGIATIPFVLLAVFGFSIMDKNSYGIILMCICGLFCLPFLLWAIYVIVFSKFVFLILIYVGCMFALFAFKHGVSWVSIIFWTQIYYILIPTLCVFALGGKINLIRFVFCYLFFLLLHSAVLLLLSLQI
ncbi:hypothetical protein RFI_14813 [Reticulomyxa filosa]|uniref:Uncharacterized protein n=1 Tax=Reticulomyxa filosa TaxID=46433 RepID=X6NAR4_RETFI|nr:hypothetical protein RFI_14813 [Reticulomyxa filosa]|eukprot:ETO22387.1 hypothetical protein RFI_14813 [Reticulomyxa filosa]